MEEIPILPPPPMKLESIASDESNPPTVVAELPISAKKKADSFVGPFSFLSCVPDTGKLGRAKASVMADRWNTKAWQLVVDWAQRDSVASTQAKRALYKGILEVFPTCGRLWKDLVEMEMARGKRENVEEYFTTSLLSCQYVPLWLTYLAYIKGKQHATPVAAREEAIKAYEFALTHIGMDPDSAPVWQSYIQFLRALETANMFEENDRISTIRSVYQRAVVLPLEGLESIWQEYLKWEQKLDSSLALQLQQKFSKPYTDARVACRERSGYTKGIRRGGSVLAVPPNSSDDTLHQVTLWKRLILYEKCVEIAPSAASAAATTRAGINEGAMEVVAQRLKRLRFTYDGCLAVLRYYPEVWIDYANTIQSLLMEQGGASGKEIAHDAARKIWLASLAANPSSLLLHLCYAAFLESIELLAEASSLFEMILERDSFSESDKQLALIQNLMFVRRSRGLNEGRRFSLRAFSSPHSSWQLFVCAARIELFMNREPVPARKLLEHGMRTYNKHIPYLLQCISLLQCMNEEGNMRVMFDQFMKDEEVRHNRELWEEYLRFEITYGNLQSVEAVCKRREAALGSGVDPQGIFATLNRFKVFDLFPASLEEIRAMSTGVNVMLKDGRREVERDKTGHLRHLLSSSTSGSSTGNALPERGNPLTVLFRNPDALRTVPRPILNGDDCGLTPLTREMIVGAVMPGDENTRSIPEPLLDLIAALVPPDEYNGPILPVDDLIALFQAVTLPAPPPATLEPIVGMSHGVAKKARSDNRQ